MTRIPAFAFFLAAFFAAYSHSASPVWDGSVNTGWYDASAQAYSLTTAEELAGLAKLVNDGSSDFSGKTITLADDIVLNDTSAGGGWRNWGTATSGLSQWTVISTSEKQFKGVFDGAGHSIAGMHISGSAGYQGLFGYAGSGAVIKNVGVSGFYVKGGNNVGGLAGYSSGAITNSYASGSVSGGSYVGGLVGRNNGGSITNSYASGSVSGGSYVGGLVGRNNGGSITNSYASGSVSGSGDVGGLAGWNSGTVSNSYASGTVSGDDYVGGLVGSNYVSGTITNVYWDMESSGQSKGIGENSGSGIAVGKTTAEMRGAGLVDTLNFGAYALNQKDSNPAAQSWLHFEGGYPKFGSAPAPPPPNKRVLRRRDEGAGWSWRNRIPHP